MLTRKFDIQDWTIAFDAETSTLSMTVEPAFPTYDEVALLLHGWRFIASCEGLRRLVVTIELPAEPRVTITG